MLVPFELFAWIVIGLSDLAIRATDACQRAVLAGQKLTAVQKQSILDLHNAKRQAVANGRVMGQPPAGNMLELKWDEELATKAHDWASSCKSEDHDSLRQIKRFPIGQNIATFWTSKKPLSPTEMVPDFERVINMWYEEFKRYHYGKITRIQPAGHYTQMIWAQSYLIGCGYSFYYDARRGYTKNYVCYYGPRGNVLSHTPYENSYPTCQNYKLDYSRKWDGLCDLPNSYRAYSQNSVP